MPQSVPWLRGTISHAPAQVDAAVLQRTREKFQYRQNMCYVIRGAHETLVHKT